MSVGIVGARGLNFRYMTYEELRRLAIVRGVGTKKKVNGKWERKNRNELIQSLRARSAV